MSRVVEVAKICQMNNYGSHFKLSEPHCAVGLHYKNYYFPPHSSNHTIISSLGTVSYFFIDVN